MIAKGKVIRIDETTVTIGKDDGVAEVIPLTAVSFTPIMSQLVDVYADKDGNIVVFPDDKIFCQRASLIFRFIRWFGFGQIVSYLIVPFIEMLVNSFNRCWIAFVTPIIEFCVKWCPVLWGAVLCVCRAFWKAYECIVRDTIEICDRLCRIILDITLGTCRLMWKPIASTFRYSVKMVEAFRPLAKNEKSEDK